MMEEWNVFVDACRVKKSAREKKIFSVLFYHFLPSTQLSRFWSLVSQRAVFSGSGYILLHKTKLDNNKTSESRINKRRDERKGEHTFGYYNWWEKLEIPEFIIMSHFETNSRCEAHKHHPHHHLPPDQLNKRQCVACCSKYIFELQKGENEIKRERPLFTSWLQQTSSRNENIAFGIITIIISTLTSWPSRYWVSYPWSSASSWWAWLFFAFLMCFSISKDEDPIILIPTAPHENYILFAIDTFGVCCLYTYMWLTISMMITCSHTTRGISLKDRTKESNKKKESTKSNSHKKLCYWLP